MKKAEKVRLNKYIAACGVCSRREADKLIYTGRVYVNGRQATMGLQVSEEDELVINGKKIAGKNKRVVLAYYKPVGVTCTEKDKFATKTIRDVLDYPVRVTYAGRLDKDSEGLMIMTNDGDLIEAMMRGSKAHEKEYLVKVDKELTGDFLSKMEQGVYLKELELTTRPCSLEQLGKYTFRIILTQGVNRQIRRMCKTLGYQVQSIKRIRIINIELEKLHPGEYREVKGEELQLLFNLCGLQL